MTSYNIRPFNFVTGRLEKIAIDRIVYYTRKVNDYSRRRFDILRGRPVQRPPANRYARLIAYRDAIRRSSDESDSAR